MQDVRLQHGRRDSDTTATFRFIEDFRDHVLPECFRVREKFSEIEIILFQNKSPTHNPVIHIHLCHVHNVVQHNKVLGLQNDRENRTVDTAHDVRANPETPILIQIHEKLQTSDLRRVHALINHNVCDSRNVMIEVERPARMFWRG